MKMSYVKEDFPALTGIRFVAVSMIFLLHYNWAPVFTGFWKDILNQFYLGVQLFFVLSGFLICFKYYEPSAFRRVFFTGFFIKRFARVYPLFFLLTTVTYIDKLVDGKTEHWWPLYLLNITFIKGFSSQFMFTGIYPAWSLTVEETFYILAPLIFVLHKKYRLFISQILFFWAFGAVLILFFNKFPFYGFFKDFQFVTMATFFGRCFEFFAGFWLALYLKRRVSKNGSYQIRSAKFPAFTTIGILGFISVILAQSFFFPQYPLPDKQLVFCLLFSNILFPVSVTILLYGLISEETVVKKLLSHPLAILLGRSSYAFFLVHASIISTWLMKYIANISISALYVILNIISIILFLTVEQPLRTFINNKSGRLLHEKARHRYFLF